MAVLSDLRLAIRTLRKNPGFTAVALLTLAISVGINATVFTVTNAVLFKGFPLVARNDRIVYISDGGCCIPYADFEDYRAQAKSFKRMAIVHGVGAVLNDSTGIAERISANENSWEVFRLVGAQPFMGRDFTAADEQDGAPPVIILNYSFWESRYGGDPHIIGRVVRMNGAPTTVIGVMPDGFSFPQRVDAWVPLVRTPKVLSRDNQQSWFAFGPLADGATFESARAEINIITKRIRAEYPKYNRDFIPKVQHFHQFFIGANAVFIYGSMWGAVGFVLLIACANLANLLLSRAIGRSREISVRIALGAGRWRIIRQLLMESVLLSGIGGILGWWVAKWGLYSYAAAMSVKASWLILDYRMDTTVLLYLIAISVVTGVLFGLAPALQLSKLDVNTALKDGGRGSTGTGRSKHLSSILVSGEMALAIVLLAGAGVMIRSFLKIHTADMGVKAEDVLVASVNLPPSYATPESRISFFDRLTAQVQSLPGVESIALTAGLPTWNIMPKPYELADRTPTDDANRPRVLSLKISPGYFHTLQARVLSGRDFSDHDGSASAPVVIVNEKLAARFWPGQNPLGKRLRFFNGTAPQPWVSVAGVVSNIIQNDQQRQEFLPIVYIPFRQDPDPGMWVIARTTVPPATVAAAFRRQYLAMTSDVPLYGPLGMVDRLESYWDSRFYGTLFLVFAGIALLLASVGLYTVIAHSVSRRTQELGIRMAIGAGNQDILRLVLREGMVPLAIGLIAGLTASFGVNRLVASMLVVSPSDPASLITAALVLLAAALLGCLIPARRAMRVDPLVALRHE
jgi:predicted permease